MENYGSHSFNGNYSGYRYPHPNDVNNTQPPPLSPQPPHVYPYNPSYSLPYPEQPPYSNNFGPLDYHPPSFHSPYQPPYLYPTSNPPYMNPNSTSFCGYNPPRPSLQYQGSFQYASVSPGYPHNYPPLPSRNESFHSYHRQESLPSLGASPSNHDGVNAYPSHATSSSPLYPLDDLMYGIHLFDHDQVSSKPESPLVSNLSRPGFQSMSSGYEREGMYGYPNHSFLSTSDPYYNPVLQHSGDLSPPSFSASPSSSNGSQHGQSLQIIPFDKSKASLKVLLLHGSLEVLIVEAKNLPNMDLFHKKLADVFGPRLTGSVSSKIEAHVPRVAKITSDPYVSFSISNAVLGKTYVISNDENPVWNQHFCVPVAHYASEVCFIVKDNDVVGSELIGKVVIPAERINTGEKFEGSFPIIGTNGKPCKPGAVLSLSIQYISIEKLTMFRHGVGMGPTYSGVPGTYFPLRIGGKVTLYQDAHVPEGCLPDLKLDQGIRYVHGKCWQDIFDAISRACRLIYIAGWSVYHKVRLVRDASYASDCTLGDLLKSKSQEGVRVLLLVWDDPTSRSILGYKMDGVMQTHDEETRRFFKHSSVQVLLCPRSAGKRHSWFKQQEVGTFFTHHQKTVVVDSDAGNRKRKIIAFVGGLDLCKGRYDTPSHSLFRTLQTDHKDDYRNPTFGVPDISYPREPWHDLHCKIDGPAAYDVLTNFEDRWLKASKPHGIEKLKRSYDDALLKIERISDIIGMPAALCLNENDPEAWHVQVFRSIDSNSVKGFPKDPKYATYKNLVCGKNVLIDMSIHTAYVTAIRAAQHFIYIENQYFYGSSYNWASHNDIGCDNLIPMEIALKIANKIKANERFSAYIVIPMWPEGVPTSIPTQRILFWQNKTMRMMYEIVYKALEEVGLEKTYEPQDFLNFFCLGNREALDGNDATYGNPTTANTPHELSRRNRRFMIYVHSKGMIVDDEYVILGSANINQRSMDGSRDTEIAMGAYQPQHTWARKGASPHGQIYGYRMSLWAEHIGCLEESFTHPESLECVKRVRTVGELNWKQFAADEVTEMRGHLLKYPVEVDARGKVKPLSGCEMFPDVGGRIVGSFTAIQENLTT